MVTLNLRGEPTGAVYSNLVTWAAQHCSEFRFITYDRWPLQPAAEELIDRLRRDLLGEAVVSSWPGTQLGAGWSAQLWQFKVTQELVENLLSLTSGFADWGGDLPEDPHFTRADGAVLLASTSSEEDVWLELTDHEAEDLAAVPDLEVLRSQ